jgi:hypothetical protein
MAEPARDRRNIHTRFNAASCKQVPQVVMGDSLHADLFGRAVHRLLALPNANHALRLRFIGRCACIASNIWRMSGIIGTSRNSPFFVPVSGSPRTMILPLVKSQSAQVMNAASNLRNPPKDRNRTNSAHGFENPLPAFSIASTKETNLSNSGNSNFFDRSPTRLTNRAGLSYRAPLSTPISKTPRRMQDANCVIKRRRTRGSTKFRRPRKAIGFRDAAQLRFEEPRSGLEQRDQPLVVIFTGPRFQRSVAIDSFFENGHRLPERHLAVGHGIFALDSLALRFLQIV